MMLHIHLTIVFLLAFSFQLKAQVSGCTDPLALNYDPVAIQNDGSCTYAASSITPLISIGLDTLIFETSGLVYWNNSLWTHNDNFDPNIYSIDTATGIIIDTTLLPNAVNVDWEEMSQDSNYLYVGDVGNNVYGNRTDLKIFRITKASILLNQPVIDTIHFSYSDQVDFTNAGMNNTDFDCEAFIVSDDSIYLFTKQWINNGTKVYVIPKAPGIYSAEVRSTYNVQGLITGATVLEEKKLLVLSGYSTLLQPFIYCLYDYDSTGFFSGNKRKIDLTLPFHQVEGIATSDGLKYYLTNDYFTLFPLPPVPQKLHIVDLSSYLGNYLDALTGEEPEGTGIQYSVFPNPSHGWFNFRLPSSIKEEDFILSDISGRIVLTGNLKPGENSLDGTALEKGIYFVRIGTGYSQLLTIL